MKFTNEQLQFLVSSVNGAPIHGTDGARVKGELLISLAEELETQLSPTVKKIKKVAKK